MDRRAFLAASTAVALGVAGCSGGGSPDETETSTGGSDATRTATETVTRTATDTETATETATAPAEATTTVGPSPVRSATVGEVVGGAELSVVVREVSETTSVGRNRRPEAGNVFQVVRIAVKNTTPDRFVDLSGFLRTTLVDSEGDAYSQSVPRTGQSLTGGQLAPGAVARGDVVFEVPEGAGPFTLRFDFSAVSALPFDRARIALSEAASPVADLEQTLRVPIHDVGASVSRGDATVALHGVSYAIEVGTAATAASGHEYAVLDVTTTNGSDAERRLSTPLQMLVKDGRGRTYAMDPTATSSLTRAYETSAPLASGESRRGTLAFEVPMSASPLYWTFEFSLWAAGDKAFWGLR